MESNKLSPSPKCLRILIDETFERGKNAEEMLESAAETSEQVDFHGNKIRTLACRRCWGACVLELDKDMNIMAELRDSTGSALDDYCSDLSE